MEAQIDPKGNQLLLNLTEEDKAYLIVLGLQYCLNEGILELNGKPTAQIAAEVSKQLTSKEGYAH